MSNTGGDKPRPYRPTWRQQLTKESTVWILAITAVLLLTACKQTPPQSGQTPGADNYPTLNARANELGEALGRKDYAKVVDLTYPKVIESAGGRDKLLAAMTNELKTMEAEGVQIISSKSSPPSQFLHDAGAIYAVVPMTSKFKAQDGIFQVEGSLIAISTDAGQNWTFIDATGKDQSELKKFLPNFEKLNVPPEKPPVKVAS